MQIHATTLILFALLLLGKLLIAFFVFFPTPHLSLIYVNHYLFNILPQESAKFGYRMLRHFFSDDCAAQLSQRGVAAGAISSAATGNDASPGGGRHGLHGLS